MDELYKNSVNRVVDFIQANLDTELTVKQLSEKACFSEFHFSRIFKAVTGESVYHFIKRLRLEKSAGLLWTNHTRSIVDIALMCGFSSSSSFAKSFKNHFKMTATEWRNMSSTLFDKEAKSVQMEGSQISFEQGSPVWTFQKEDSIRQVVIEDIPPFKVAYVRNVGPYEGDALLFDQLHARLMEWAVPRECLPDTDFTLNIYHDNPEITETRNLRVMVAIPVLDTAVSSGPVGIKKISGGKYGVCNFLLKEDEFADAWDWIFSVWLAHSGYELDQREVFERCRGERILEGTRFFDVDICLPIQAK